jgi:hypothetical protein
MLKAIFGSDKLTMTDIVETIFGDDDLVRSQDPKHPVCVFDPSKLFLE